MESPVPSQAPRGASPPGSDAAAVLGPPSVAASAAGIDELLDLSSAFAERSAVGSADVADVLSEAALAYSAYAAAVAALPPWLRREAAVGVVPRVFARLVAAACAQLCGGAGSSKRGPEEAAQRGGGAGAAAASAAAAWTPESSRAALAELVRAWDPALDEGPVLVLRYAALLLPGTAHHFDPVVDATTQGWLIEQASAMCARLDATLHHGAAGGPSTTNDDDDDDAGAPGQPRTDGALREHLARLAAGLLPYGLRGEAERAVPQLHISLADLLTPEGALHALTLNADARAWLSAAAARGLSSDAAAAPAGSSTATLETPGAGPAGGTPLSRRTRKYLQRLAQSGLPPGFAAGLP